jgi:hypothetical protein
MHAVAALIKGGTSDAAITVRVVVITECCRVVNIVRKAANIGVL